MSAPPAPRDNGMASGRPLATEAGSPVCSPVSSALCFSATLDFTISVESVIAMPR